MNSRCARYPDMYPLQCDKGAGRQTAYSFVARTATATLKGVNTDVGDNQQQDRRGVKFQLETFRADGPISDNMQEDNDSEDKYSAPPKINETADPLQILELNQTLATSSNIAKTLKKGSSMKHEGIPYICSSAIDGQVKLRCHLYLPAGKSVHAPDAKWTGYKTAKKGNPSGNPYRCPGILLIDCNKSQTFLSVMHECGNLSEVNQPPATGGEENATSMSGLGQQQAGDGDNTSCLISPAISTGKSVASTQLSVDVQPTNLDLNGHVMHLNDQLSDSLIDPLVIAVNHENQVVSDSCVAEKVSMNIKIPKNGSYLYHEGVRYRCSSTKNGITRYRCARFLPGGSPVTTHDAAWTGYKARKRNSNPSGMPYRCPGVLMLDHNKDQSYVVIAHECGGHSDTLRQSSASSFVHHTELRKQAIATVGHADDTIHQMEVGTSIDESLPGNQSLVNVQPTIDGLPSTLNDRLEPEGARRVDEIDDDVDVLDDHENNSAFDNDYYNDDENSVASDKPFYKGLCARLTEALVKKRKENSEYKQTIKRLKKENKDINKQLNNVCSNHHMVGQYTPLSFSQKYA